MSKFGEMVAAWFAVALAVTAIGQPSDIELKGPRCTITFCPPPAPRGYEPQSTPEEPEIQIQPRAPGLPPPLNLIPST